MADHLWVAVNVYPGDHAKLDAVVGRLAAAVPAACDFFFIRYTDARGQHIRLRVMSDENDRRRLFARLVEIHRFLRRPPGSRPNARPGGVVVQRYLREVRRYQSLANVAELESVWCAHSRTIATFLAEIADCPESERETRRLAAGRAVLLQLYSDVPSAPEALRRHRDHWWRGAPEDVRRERIIAVQSASLADERMPLVAAAPALPDLPSDVVAFHLAHLNVNRLGLDVVAEGALVDSLLIESSAEGLGSRLYNCVHDL